MATLPVDIVTGFLGSGKTTLLRYVLEHGLDGRRVAVIMNEIGEVGIDGRAITGLRAVEKMVELNSGCICCSISGRFALALQEIIDLTEPELIVIETTGIAEAEPLMIDIRENGLLLDAVITVVDALNILPTADKFIVAAKQIGAADFLVLNKTDLVTSDHLSRVEAFLRAHNPWAQILRTTFGKVPTEVIFDPALPPAGRPLGAAASHTHGHLREEAIRVFAYRSDEVLDQDRFKAMLDRLPQGVVRAKGLLRFSNSHWSCLFNYTSGRWDLRWHAPIEGATFENQAVFIGPLTEQDEAWIRKQLDSLSVAS